MSRQTTEENDMASKISKPMAQQLAKALGNPSYEVVGARTNTERALADRGLIFHGRLREAVTDARGHQVRTHGMMLTDEGVKEAQRLAAEAAEERGEEPQAAEVTREDVARGVDDALQWLPYGDRDAARARGAVRVLTMEFTRARRVMRKLLGSNRYEVEAQAVAYYGRVRALLAAAKRFEQEDTAQEGQEGSKVQEQQEQGAPVVTRLAVARNESGMGGSMRVEFVLTAHYADREPVRTAPMSIKGLRANTSAARMPEVVCEQLARFGGMAYRVEGRWTLVDPDSEAARLAGTVSRTEVEEARRAVLARLSESYREELRHKPASVVLGHEFSYTRREAARFERVSGAGDLEAMRARHLRAGALLEAARRFEEEDARPAVVDVMRAEAESVAAVSAAFAARVRGEERPQEPDMAAMSEEEHAAAFGERFAQVRRARVEEARVLGLEVSVRVVSYRAESCAFEGEEDHECESDCTWLEGDLRELEDRGSSRFEADSDDLEAFEGDAVAWAADYIRTKTGAVHPSVSPVGEELGEHEWLSGSYEDPYQGDERVTETTVRLVGDWTPQERARVFRAVMA